MTDKGYLHRRSENFGKLPEPLMHDPTVTDGAKVMYCHMHWRYGSDCKNFEGRKSMADTLDISETAVSDRITELVEHDWIVIVARSNGRGRTTNFYHVFEYQADCIAWRQEHKADKPSLKLNADGTRKFARKSRRGVGGKPSHKTDDSIPTQVGQGISTQVDPPKINSSSRPYPDSVSDTYVSSAQVPKPTPASVQVFKPALTEKPKRKPKTPADPFYVFESVDGKSLYTGPFKDMAKAQRHAAGHGTVTQQQAIPPGSLTRPVPVPPRPRDPVYDAIAAGSYNMTTIEGKSRYIGVMAAGVRDCTPEEYRATLADDLPKMYAWYKTAHPGISAPARTETICKYLAEWRTATLASASTAMFEEVRGPNPYNPNPNLSTLRMRS